MIIVRTRAVLKISMFQNDPVDLLRRTQSGSGAMLTVPQTIDLNKFLPISFSTVFDYLLLLEYATKALAPAGRNAMVYLSAAVADFYLPLAAMATDKIQSSHNGLSLSLSHVPKVIPYIKISTQATPWAPEAFLISFKLETNPNILVAKAAGAIRNAGVDVVIANILNQHRSTVHVIKRDGECDVSVVHPNVIIGDEQQPVQVIGVSDCVISKSNEREIEADLIEHLIELHSLYAQ
eukprot:c8376_g1_i4.p1 GENE.c8376_g1_i4~~c8376_g1_i4.p1  ORF type:complete len:236 (+),score=61.39 c8376_g1_i4:412-1119(+)